MVFGEMHRVAPAGFWLMAGAAAGAFGIGAAIRLSG